MQKITQKKLDLSRKFLRECGQMKNTGGGLYLSGEGKIGSYRERLDDATFLISLLTKEILSLESEKADGK
jgi:hypothetical protein